MVEAETANLKSSCWSTGVDQELEPKEDETKRGL
jgi:hypothetical protein